MSLHFVQAPFPVDISLLRFYLIPTHALLSGPPFVDATPSCRGFILFAHVLRITYSTLIRDLYKYSTSPRYFHVKRFDLPGGPWSNTFL